MKDKKRVRPTWKQVRALETELCEKSSRCTSLENEVCAISASNKYLEEEITRLREQNDRLVKINTIFSQEIQDLTSRSFFARLFNKCK